MYVTDFGLPEIINENAVVLIDACAVQASPESVIPYYGGYVHSQHERMLYVTLIDSLSDGRIFVTPGVRDEIKKFVILMDTLSMPGRYRKTLNYVCDKLSRRELEPTKEEAENIRSLDARLRFFNRSISRQDYEMLIYGLAIANKRGAIGVLTNDSGIVETFRQMSQSLDWTDYEPKNTFSIYVKYGMPKFRREVRYP